MPAAWRRLGRLSQAFDASSPSTASNATPRAAWQDECIGKRALFRSPHGNLANPILSTSVRPFQLAGSLDAKMGCIRPQHTHSNRATPAASVPRGSQPGIPQHCRSIFACPVWNVDRPQFQLHNTRLSRLSAARSSGLRRNGAHGPASAPYSTSTCPLTVSALRHGGPRISRSGAPARAWALRDSSHSSLCPQQQKSKASSPLSSRLRLPTAT